MASYGYPYPHQASAMNPFASLVPTTFPPGTDPNLVACYYAVDEDNSGLIDDIELQTALSSCNQEFSLRTIHLLMYLFTHSNKRQIGPKEFVSVYHSLQSWKETFERFDRDNSGMIEASELREAILSLGYVLSPPVLDLLLSKYDQTQGNRAVAYGSFIECCLIVKGLSDKFKAKDHEYNGLVTFSYEEFLLTVLPFLIA